MLGLAHTLIALLHGMRHGARTCSGNRRHRQGRRVGGDSIVARWRPIADFFNSIGQIRLFGDVTSMSGLPARKRTRLAKREDSNERQSILRPADDNSDSQS
jgi:hypothetical protein